MLGKDYAGQECALASTLEVLGERWTLLIVRDAFFGVRRYSDFVARLDIPRAVLADRLRSLVHHGVLAKRDDHLYELTPAGKELWPALHALMTWGSKNRRKSASVYRHAGCGAELAAGGFCPSCGLAPRPEDVVTAPRRRAQVRRSDPVSAIIRQPRRLLEPVDVVAVAPVKLGG